ncbi:MAG: DUF4160 domain-containing protein [Oscillospiraceae bacterium]|nr:DUF4160 domain-containing protein [Oscillospiraceae bacterium]
MGKLKKYKIGNHYLYITSKCTPGGEPPHIHSNKSKMLSPSSAGKLWVNSDGTSKVEKSGGASTQELKAIKDWLLDNIAVVQGEWEKLGGNWVWFSKI